MWCTCTLHPLKHSFICHNGQARSSSCMEVHELKLCWSGLLVVDQGEKMGYLLSLSHIASCSNTLKNLRADALSKASMLSNFKHQWNIMTQNRRWPEKFRIFLSPSKLSYHISRTWYSSLKEQKSENLKVAPPPYVPTFQLKKSFSRWFFELEVHFWTIYRDHVIPNIALGHVETSWNSCLIF